MSPTVFGPSTLRLRIVVRMALLASCLIGASPICMAQLEEIVVTAQRRIENLQDVPVAVTAFDGQRLQRENIFRVDDLASRVPGLFISSGNSVGTTRMNLRGVFSEPNNVGLGNSIPNYVDGIAMGPGRTLDIGLFDLEAVEVLRGPQGTLFGRNSTGGAVLYRTRQPNTDKTEAFASASFGNYDAQRYQAMINVPASDRIAFRLAASLETNNGFAYNITRNQRQNDQDSKGARAQGLFRLNDDWQVTIRGDWSQDEQLANVKDFASNASGGKFNPASYDRVVLTDQPSITNRKTYGANAEVLGKIGGLKFISLTAYANFDYFAQDDVDYTAQNALSTTAAVQQHQVSQEFRLESDTSKALSWVGGLYYFNEAVKSQNGAYGQLLQLVGAAPNPSTFRTVGTGDRDTKSYAAFGQARWAVTPTVAVTAGLRYTKEDGDAFKFQPTGLAPLGIQPLSSNIGLSDSDWSGTFKVQYEPTDAMMFYASWSHGFKGSGFNLSPGGPAQYTAKPEFVDALELGVRSEWLDRRLRLNATLFDYDYRDLQRSTFTSTGGSVPTTIFGNAGKLTSKGAEVELAYSVLESLQVGGTFGYTDAKFKDYLALQGNVVVDRSGNRPSYTPGHTYSFFFDFTYPGFSAVNVNFRGDYQYRAESYVDDRNLPNFTVDNVSLGNLTLAIEDKSGRWGTSAFVKNVGDARYNLNVVSASGLTPGIGIVMGAPRTYGVQLFYRY